jgi:glycosyltransferase involved in cell wall biosynthesis
LKRIDLLLKALSFMDSSVRCKIAGTGPEREQLEHLARELNILDRVDFLGFVSDEELIQLYGECTAVFFAPQDEDYGYITLEAFLSKKPVITAIDSGGPLEFVEHQQNGLVMEHLEPDKMGPLIEGLVMNKDRCEEFGLEGFSRVEHITWDPVIEALLGNA